MRILLNEYRSKPKADRWYDIDVKAASNINFTTKRILTVNRYVQLTIA